MATHRQSSKTALKWHGLPLITLGISVLYFSTHLFSLTLFPIFADESIYIRWAQLIIDDWQQYLFFAMNDGKTPLFIWSLIPFQFLFHDQVFAARFVSVLVGFGQVLLIKEVVRALGGRQKAQWMAMILTSILPFWFFYHRVALMDSMLTLWISLTVLGTIQLVTLPSALLIKMHKPIQTARLQLSFKHLLSIALVAISVGLGLWTKLPMLFALPALLVWPLLPAHRTWPQRAMTVSMIALSVLIGCVFFALLKLSPAFGQLFSRGQDFTYPVSEVIFKGRWQQTLPNIPTYINYFIQYLTLPVLFVALAGVFCKYSRRQVLLLLFSGIFFCLPFILFGKVVYARYFLPAAFFWTTAAVISFQGFFDQFFRDQKNLAIQLSSALVLTTICGTVVTASAKFLLPALFSPNQTPFVSSDTQQYLTEWSSGHGITQTVSIIHSLAQDHSVAVATEGRFGTLPDALLVYFHRQNTQNIYIEGTGQYPVKSLPEFFIKRAKTMDQSLLVVNSHRMAIDLPPEKLLHQFCRSYHAPCLQIWDVTALVKSL